MARDPSMPFDVNSYVGDTQHLTTEQHGAYLLLLFSAWKRGGVLPNDDAQLAAIARLTPSKWAEHRTVLIAFFMPEGPGLTQKRIRRDLLKAKRYALPDAAQDGDLFDFPKGGGLPDCPHETIVALWKECRPEMPQPMVWNETRRAQLKTRWREAAQSKRWASQDEGLAYFRRLFVWIGRSRFLTGRVKPQGDRQVFMIELPWLILPANWLKVLEGSFHGDDA